MSRKILDFNIEKHDEIYDMIVNQLGFAQEVFVTDDIIIIDTEEEANKIKTALPHIHFTDADDIIEEVTKRKG